MSRQALSVGAAALAFAYLSTPCLAEQRAWLSQEEVTKKLTETAGYSHVTRLEPDKDHWDGKGMKDGKLMHFRADPKTGAVLKEEFDR
jgi:hypothetical protein